MPGPCEDCGRSMHWPGSPGGTEGDASAAQGVTDREYPWGRGSAGLWWCGHSSAAVVFQPPRAAHPASCTGGPALPAPRPIIRRAAGVQWSRALPWVTAPSGGALLGGLVLDTRPYTVLKSWGTEVVLGQHPLLNAPSMGPCGGAAVASAGLTQWELEKSHRFPIRCFVPSKRPAALSN